MLNAQTRRRHEQWLLELTGIPTAAGREGRVIKYITQWVKRRKNLSLTTDDAGNLLVQPSTKPRATKNSKPPKPLFITAHLDHPAFVVSATPDEHTVELEFRGGVADAYFDQAQIEIIDSKDESHRATILDLNADIKPFKTVTAQLHRSTNALKPGDIGRWAFTGRGATPTISEGLLQAHACDDLAAVAAALAVMDELRDRKEMRHVGLLFTLAEEIGFIGAIAACKKKSAPTGSRLLCLENSRSFPTHSPIGAGAVIRVGDRMSVFEPKLTNAITDLIAEYAADNPDYKYQRKLMAGGRCEASVFSAFGYASTCLCLPLGNYHNQVDIDGVAQGVRPARTGPEYISIDDYHSLIDMLIAIAERLDDDETKKRTNIRTRLNDLYKERSFVLDV